MEEYPKALKLKDGTTVRMRLMSPDDLPKLLEFFRSLPEEDRLFLKDDVTNPEVIERWIRELDYDRVLPVLAEVEGKIVGDATLHLQKHGWMRHLGEVRLVVAREFQRKGLGTILAREIFHHAVLKGLQKLLALMMESQIGALKAFRRLGFRREAVLKDHVIDLKGNRHDLIFMTNDVAELWRKIGDLILESEFTME
jgi:RimJ/RimL family protein N-acetyltransferase